ncbi:MAG: hypothetical protein QM773_08880 [Hyphomonadaceae bacterium]
MSLPLRLLTGFGAAFAAVAFVTIAGLTAPRAETTLHASATCPDAAKTAQPAEVASEADRPA